MRMRPGKVAMAERLRVAALCVYHLALRSWTWI
jgi:hypothetical protein